ncbi:MAG: hypothetical protein QOI12_1825 [Alphaproteobacteria bacterium]|jgi:hypothetical protein|nr:hypothetical protein [Alphaproteobacteria bacterium]
MNVGAILFTSILAAVIAIWGIISQRAIARRRTTFEHIVAMEADRSFIIARRKFIALSKQPGGLSPWASEDKESTPEAQNIRLVLNEFEVVSIAIQRGIIDFETYRRWYQSTVIRFWAHAKPYAEALRARTNHPSLFQEFEVLERWMKSPPHRYKWLRFR